jgi:hypothetical protein
VIKALRKWVLVVETHEAQLERKLQELNIPKEIGWDRQEEAITLLTDIETFTQQLRSTLDSQPKDNSLWLENTAKRGRKGLSLEYSGILSAQEEEQNLYLQVMNGLKDILGDDMDHVLGEMARY